MARARNIKPGFMENDELAECALSSHLLFACLWMVADKSGRFKDRPKRIKAKCLPYYRDASGEDISTLDQRSVNVDASLSQLQAKGFVQRYEVAGERYCQIVNWDKHQSPHHKEVNSDLPPPPESSNALLDETNVDPTSGQACSNVDATLAQRPESENQTIRESENQRIRESENPGCQEPGADVTIDAVCQTWNDLMGQKCQVTNKRRAQLRSRVKDGVWVEKWQEAVRRAAESDFCNGIGAQGWRADLEWFLGPDSVTKILEGKYDNRGTAGRPPVTFAAQREANMRAAGDRFVAGAPDAGEDILF